MLLGRAPSPGEDVSLQAAVAARSRETVATRPVFVAKDPILGGNEALLAEVAERSLVRATFAPFVWRTVMVDLRGVLAFQKVISLEGHAARVEGGDDLKTLFEVCLPTEQPQVPAGAFRDSDGKGLAVGSTNPNLRIVGTNASAAMLQLSADLPPVPVQAMTVFVQMGISYLQVVRYRGRCFLRDGYHRATALLRRGIHTAPAILIEARSFDELAVPAGGLGGDVVFGERPPSLVDFWGDAAAEVEQVAVRKIVRVRGDEFVVAQ
jgi:hypothetical protein